LFPRSVDQVLDRAVISDIGPAYTDTPAAG
jgi:hypothetical protein